MSVDALYQAIQSFPFRPKGIKVGAGLWREMIKDGQIKWKRGYLKGVIDSEIDFPILGEEIFFMWIQILAILNMNSLYQSEDGFGEEFLETFMSCRKQNNMLCFAI